MIEEELTVASAAAEASAEDAPAPRRRRTTRKQDSAEENASSSQGESAPARRRTRSRKVAAESNSVEKAAASEEAAAAEEAAPKRRSRKPAAKSAAKTEPAAEGKEASSPSEKQGKAAEGAARKAAGSSARKAAEPASAEAEGTSRKTADQASAAPEASSEAAPTPRRRTRVRKAAEDEAASDSAKQARPAASQAAGGSQTNGHERAARHDNQKQNRSHRSDNQNNHRHQRSRRNNSQREVTPSVSMEELGKLKVAELRAKAAELGVDVSGLKKAELVAAVYDASVKAEGFIEVTGVLDILADGYGFLRTQGYLPSETDCYVGLSTIRRNGLRKGDMVRGQTRPARENEKYAAIQKIISVNGIPVDELGARVKFADLTPIYPDECLRMEHGKNTITARVIDLVSPIGKGQRGLIVSPPKAGKTTILKDVASAITANNPEVHLMCLLVDERPEEVTDMQRSIKGEVISSTFDMPTENHIAVAELVIERAKRLVECGRDVVILLDSITRLARAYNLAQPASGRILSGGVDSTALYPPKRFLGAARNIEHGGSLTILASALIDTGSKMDEVIFEEFKGTGNMELKLDRNLADRRIFPAIDPVASGTRKEDLLLDPQQAPLIWAVRRILANLNNTERAMDMLIKSLKQTDNNTEFLLRTAKKAQHTKMDSVMEL